MSADPCFETIASLSRRIAARELSPVDLVRACIARIEALDAQLNAVLTPTFERALDQARIAEAEIAKGRARGPLHGIPFGLKDIYETAGTRTTAQSKILIDGVPAADATTVTRLYAAGAVLLAKLTTHEFAHGGPSFDLPWPPARNPWNPERFTGGSSSGSAAAVAAGFLPLALGSDTGGSIRNPAALCGVAGLKPTYGLVSRHGVIPNSFTFDHCGPLAWTAEDCAIALSALAGFDPRDGGSAEVPVPDYRARLTGDIRGLRIGLVRHFWEEDLPANAEVRAAMEAAVEVFKGLGAAVEEVRLRPLQDYFDVKIVIAESELFAVHETELRARPGDFGRDFLTRCLPAVLIRAEDYVAALRERRKMLAEAEAVYARFDLLLTAGPYGPAPRIDAHRSLAFFEKPSIATPFNVLAGPALVQCAGFSADGLPLALQLAGRPFDDATVLRAGHAFEAATGWRARRPTLDPARPPATNRIVYGAPEPASLAPAARDRVAHLARRAGLALSEEQFETLCAAAPLVEAMGQRLRTRRDPYEEPAATYRFPILAGAEAAR
ncbi:MAG: amidase [Proteobacteria bacterium]|nr:amidase [Pseudomonadota bacterium]